MGDAQPRPDVRPPSPAAGVTALAGGVGAARFLRGLVEVVAPADVIIVGNTGDDETFHGLHVSPDLDSVTYTLADASNPETGWGLAGETFACMDALDRYGVDTWFRLGDRDLATHLYRTTRLSEGASLTEVTAEITRAWGLGSRLLPMSDDPAPTRLRLASGETVPMQEWFVRHRSEPAVASVDLGAASAARAPAGVVHALGDAPVVVLCPSNPLISLAPILAVPGVRDALRGRRDRVVGISPIVGGAAVKGPADRMLRSTGVEPSAAGVARLYADICATWVIDEIDADLAPEIEAAGLRPVVAPTIMRDVGAAAKLAEVTLGALR